MLQHYLKPLLKSTVTLMSLWILKCLKFKADACFVNELMCSFMLQKKSESFGANMRRLDYLDGAIIQLLFLLATAALVSNGKLHLKLQFMSFD